MSNEKTNRLPPVIVDYITKLNDKNIPRFQKEIACTVLERIVEECSVALSRYNLENDIKRRA